ncbi:MAG: isoprenylcysteine carboxylmethyltransferase family protein [Puniceicoccales bacterium]|nr:isoprenylcysteine carboxylmethyltransferase family protein [Puniceicoccales bacterium]
MNTVFEWLKAIIILPLNVLVIIPLILLYCTNYGRQLIGLPQVTTGIILLLIGLLLAAWTMSLFARKGKGTPAPWNPPPNLVIIGPYAHVRNPMLTSVFIMQIGECLCLGSWALWIWLAVFLSINLVYLPLCEEKDLEQRFGQSYTEYRHNVPRWIPRLTPWKPSAR